MTKLEQALIKLKSYLSIEVVASSAISQILSLKNYVKLIKAYHKACSEKFSSYYSAMKSLLNRPTDTVRLESFELVCD